MRQKITSRTAEKDVEHIEIDLSGSDLRYQAGDALGVWPLNAADLVQEILDLNQLTGNETIQLSDGRETDIPHRPDRIRRHHPKHTGIRPTIRRINKTTKNSKP